MGNDTRSSSYYLMKWETYDRAAGAWTRGLLVAILSSFPGGGSSSACSEGQKLRIGRPEIEAIFDGLGGRVVGGTSCSNHLGSASRFILQ